MLKTRKSKVLLVMTVVVIMIASLLAVNMSAAAWAAEQVELNVDSSDSNAIDEWINNFSKSRIPIVYSDKVEVDLDESKAIFNENDVNKQILLLQPANWENGEGSVEDLGKIIFNEAGNIGNRNIDVIISLDKITLKSKEDAMYPNFANGPVQIACFKGGNEFWICTWNFANGIADFGGSTAVELSTDIVYSDDKSPVDLGVIHLVQDLDMGGNEGVRTIKGYSNRLYKFNGAIWSLDDSVDGELNITSKDALHDDPDYNIGADDWHDSLIKGGVFLETTGGSFKSEIRNWGSGIVYDLYSQYLNIDDATNPYKEIVDEKEEAYVAGEEVTFDVAHTMFNWNETFTKYVSLSIYDEIPDGLNYVSAKVLDSNGNDITDEGTLTYKDRTVTFDFDRGWLDAEENYNGNSVTLRIKTEVTGEVIGEIVNVGHASINGVDMETNEVDIEVEEPEPDPEPSPDPDPYKEIVDYKGEAYTAGEEVTFDVAFTMFEWYENAVKYGSLSVYDNIPEGLEYVSAKVLDGDKNDITAEAGTLSAVGNKVEFVFNEDWLNDEANYNGKDITLRIETKVTGDVLGTITNTGFVNVDGVDMETNEVDIEVENEEPEVTTAPVTTPPVTTTTTTTITTTTIGVNVITSKPEASIPTGTLELGAGAIDAPAEDIPTQDTVCWMAIFAVIALAAAGTVSAVRRKKAK